MTFIINNLGWISIPIIVFIMAILLNKLVIIVGEEKARAYKPPLTFEEFKKRGLAK